MGQVVIYFREWVGQVDTPCGQVGPREFVGEGLVSLPLLSEEPKLHGPHGGLGAVGDPELTEDPVQVFLDGARADKEVSGDLPVG